MIYLTWTFAAEIASVFYAAIEQRIAYSQEWPKSGELLVFHPVRIKRSTVMGPSRRAIA